ncbi:Delta-sarcoglycan [Pitangus sulphuratus]|nr:Delta-sarcoglycan [Pitangus sulphuratus]
MTTVTLSPSITFVHKTPRSGKKDFTLAENYLGMDGMGNLRITEKGLKLEGDSEFLKPLYAKEIRSRPGNPLYFQSARNVTVNILNEKTKVLTRLVTGPQAVEAHSQKFEVKTLSGKLLFSADDNEVVVGAERLRVLGAEGTVFPKSIETPNVRADPFKELRLESPTRALVMEAPKGIEINAEAGSLKATCRTELRLESKDGEVFLWACALDFSAVMDVTDNKTVSFSDFRDDVCLQSEGYK